MGRQYFPVLSGGSRIEWIVERPPRMEENKSEHNVSNHSK